ncbi:hypothetical protein [Aquimarina pacifica]|uniref:hypothetical protein n=1 Tax=Aquimarina pacifica TaxID=1296415 RepID=UPI00046F6D6B|nr:hypothetical protein [Aquimarina pacifica]
MKYILVFLTPLFLYILSCKEEDSISENINSDNNIATSAEITSVSVSGNKNNYTFAIGIKSPDTGCQQYADWWEIISETGEELLYRRILAHSHVSEQPFIRSGGPVSITEQQTIYIRAHMNTSGYGAIAYKGNIRDGFVKVTLETGFANQLAEIAPLPSGCAF